MSFDDKCTYAYIKNIKRRMECPVCHKKMTFKKNTKAWVCDECTYAIPEKEFLADFVFWFCDDCGTYLNNQEGFDKHAAKHICTNCGFENDTSFSNVKGMCIDCGKVLQNPDATLCAGCKQLRKQKAKEWLIKAGKVVGTVVAVAGVAYLASQFSDDDTNTDYLLLPDNDDNGDCSATKYDFITDSWMNGASEDELRAVESEMFSELNDLDYDSDDYFQLDLTRIDVVNAIASRFPLNLPHREHGWYLPNDD